MCSDKDNIKTKIDSVSERMPHIGALLDDAEKEESTQQTGGADQGLDVDTCFRLSCSDAARIGRDGVLSFEL